MIGTERLILREWKDSDLKPFSEINACPHVFEFLLKPLSRDESDAFVSRIDAHFRTHGYGLYAVEIKETGEFIGFTGLNVPAFEAHFTPAVEIGWRLAHRYWGKGYATEAARAVLAHGFDRHGLKEIVSFTVPANVRSRGVMEKIGLTYDPKDDFNHPLVPEGHRLQKHVLYRVRKSSVYKVGTPRSA